MPISVTAYKVLIGSPSDVSAERKTVERAIHTWNSMNGIRTETLLVPVMWETDSAPLQGGRPQGLLNDLMVKDCDIIISIFWWRLGTDTGVEKSGTVEEIKFFIKERRPALLYFSSKPLPQHHDPEQWQQLKEFKKEIRNGGIQENFDGEAELFEKLLRHLTVVMENIKTAPTVSSEVKKLIKEGNDSAKGTIDSLRGPSRSSVEVYLKKHTDKSFIVIGVGDESHVWPEGLHGQLVSIGNGAKAWQFSNKRASAVAAHLGISERMTP